MLDLSTIDRSPELSDDLGTMARHLDQAGFDVVGAPALRRLVEAAGGCDFDGFAASWDDLGPDRFMADGGTYRKRRFGCFAVSDAAIRIKPQQAHFQTLTHNPLNGGVARTFAPVADAIALHPVNRALLTICRALFARMEPARTGRAAWHVEMHQFRIEARPDAVGQPTPEGLHRDGVDGVLVMMVRRENLAGGESTIADGDRRPIRRATLAAPYDAVILDDRRVFHGVSGVRSLDPARPAFRDVLVLTFRAEET